MKENFKKGFGSILGLFAGLWAAETLTKLGKEVFKKLSEYQITKKGSN